MVAPALLELKEIMRTEQMQAKKMEIYSEVHARTRARLFKSFMYLPLL